MELSPIQTTARAAVESAAYYEGRTYRLESDIHDAQSAITRAEAVGDPTDALWDDYYTLNRRLSTATQAVQDARDTLHRARGDIRTAADKAISAIDTAISDGADSFGDNWNQFWEGVGDVFSAIGSWVSDFLTDLVSAIIDVIAAVLTVMLVALLAVVALVAVLALLGVALIAPYALLPLLLVIGAVVLQLVAALVLVRVLSDALKRTPTVRPHPPKREDTSGDGLAEVFEEAAYVDSEGGDAESVVKIEKIVAEDGTVSWRIVLPSTQDWQALAPFMSEEDLDLLRMMQDSGAVNDVDSNMALVLFPSLRTQYERAVIESMEQAGVRGGPDGDPIMLVGFSQGGILAGHLAANRSDAYNFAAIVVCGAPIDNMPIPDSTTVVSVQHAGDPVHALDFFTPPPVRDNWLPITATAPGNPSDVSQIHNARQYDLTLEDSIQEIEDFANLDQFFDGPGQYTETEYYAWHE